MGMQTRSRARRTLRSATEACEQATKTPAEPVLEIVTVPRRLHAFCVHKHMLHPEVCLCEGPGSPPAASKSCCLCPGKGFGYVGVLPRTQQGSSRVSVLLMR